MTGSIAGRIAKTLGCRVIGIAGGAKKCSLSTDRAGLDAAIDYKRDDIDLRLTELAPDGVDVFLDAIGGRILEHGLAHLARRGRVVLAGAISPGYHGSDPACGPRNYMRLALHLELLDDRGDLLDEYQLLGSQQGHAAYPEPDMPVRVCRTRLRNNIFRLTDTFRPLAGRADVVCSASGPRVSAWVQSSVAVRSLLLARTTEPSRGVRPTTP
ncbi:zinc-binding dehydrogenase [Nocardia gipuzkoensis]|uniref:zinc-binding dehydrogenase n=1 Tax=Nocardia gipuzkoensis TaxID=2749991 RepID=UPI00237DA477|nr:zinc-binding dehydrogenase [Nocardia gipuzkoensis]MDE1674268.1 zinc-binding dehydrogenase [Nocardia gipuzkoensis]